MRIKDSERFICSLQVQESTRGGFLELLTSAKISPQFAGKLFGRGASPVSASGSIPSNLEAPQHTTPSCQTLPEIKQGFRFAACQFFG